MAPIHILFKTIHIPLIVRIRVGNTYELNILKKMGISNWHEERGTEADEYVHSEEYANHTIDERLERIKEINSLSDVELYFLNSY